MTWVSTAYFARWANNESRDARGSWDGGDWRRQERGHDVVWVWMCMIWYRSDHRLHWTNCYSAFFFMKHFIAIYAW
jgi:hypothetical protein